MTGTGKKLWVPRRSVRVLSRDRAGHLSRRGLALSFLTLPPRRMMIQEGWARRCQLTRLWSHSCKRPSSCASRRRLQSARADTEQTGVAAQGAIPSLGVQGPVWADLKTPLYPHQSCHIHRERVSQGLGLAISLVAIFSYMLAHLTSLIFWKFENFVWLAWFCGSKDSGESWGLWNAVPNCCFLTKVMSPRAPGRCYSTQLLEPCLLFYGSLLLYLLFTSMSAFPRSFLAFLCSLFSFILSPNAKIHPVHYKL